MLVVFHAVPERMISNNKRDLLRPITKRYSEVYKWMNFLQRSATLLYESRDIKYRDKLTKQTINPQKSKCNLQFIVVEL